MSLRVSDGQHKFFLEKKSNCKKIGPRRSPPLSALSVDFPHRGKVLARFLFRPPIRAGCLICYCIIHGSDSIVTIQVLSEFFDASLQMLDSLLVFKFL